MSLSDHIKPLKVEVPAPSPVIAAGGGFSLGFRPFFAGAGITAVLFLPLWVMMFAFGKPVATYYGPLGWHSHEMVFGYVAAVMAGFVLTAATNWTGRRVLSGRPLAALAALWLAGRVFPFLPGLLPGWVIALADILFFPVLAGVVARAIIRARQPRNLVFPVLLVLLSIPNLLVHLQCLGVAQATAREGYLLSVDVVVLIVVLVTGRVMPFFTRAAVGGDGVHSRAPIEAGSIASLVLLFVLERTHAAPWLTAAVAAVAAVFHGLRWWGWHVKAVWTRPILWVLYCGYTWLIVGLLLKALLPTGRVLPVSAFHALTAGFIGVMTLGMMVRVTLGHTGRVMKAGRVARVAFVLINLAAVVRVFGPLAFSTSYPRVITTSGILWTAAFLLFLAAHLPMLWRSSPGAGA